MKKSNNALIEIITSDFKKLKKSGYKKVASGGSMKRTADRIWKLL